MTLDQVAVAADYLETKAHLWLVRHVDETNPIRLCLMAILA